MDKPIYIAKAKVYDADDNMEYIGTASVTLPSLEANTVTLEGFGVLGSIDMPAQGSFGSFKLTLGFRGLTRKNINVLNGIKNFDIRAAQQVLDTNLKRYVPQQIRMAVTGPVTTFDLGELEISNTMSVNAEIEAYSFKLWLDKQLNFELDKLNDIHKINGNDIMQAINDLVN